MYSEKECRALAEKAYPNYTVDFGFMHEGNYLVSLVPKDLIGNEAMLEVHAVDPESGDVSGCMGVMDLMMDPEFVRKMQKATGGDHLAHHGIHGQQWGVQNGPPYPLDAKTHNKVVKSSENNSLKKSSDGKEGSVALAVSAFVLTTALTVALSKISQKSEKAIARKRGDKIVQKINEHESNMTDEEKAEKRKREEQRNDEVLDQMAKDSELLKKKGIADPDKTFTAKNPPKAIEGEHTMEDDMAKINPLYNGKFSPSGTTMNCVQCSMAYDLRRRGYDVTAMLNKDGTYGEVLFESCYKKGKMETHNEARTWADVEANMVKKHPDNSRGVIFVNGFNGMMLFGHAMAWEVKGGKMVIIDCQTNKKYNAASLSKTLFVPASTRTGRTDNLEINWDKMSKCCAELIDQK